MPVSNYNTTTAYKGFTRDELTKPLEDYTKWYNALEEAHNELASNSELIGQYLKDEPGSDAAKIYNAYITSLDTATDRLAQGTDSNTMRSLLQLKRNFNSKVAPIGVAATAKQEAIKNHDAIIEKDNDVFGDDPRTHSIDEYMYGNKPNIALYSGKELYEYAAQMAKGVSERLWSDRTIDKSDGAIWSILQSQGLKTSPDGIRNMWVASVTGNGKKLQEIEDIVSESLLAKGFKPISQDENGNYIFDLKDKNVSRALDYIFNGITSGLVYKESAQTTTNPYLVHSSSGSNKKQPAPVKTYQTYNTVLAGDNPNQVINEIFNGAKKLTDDTKVKTPIYQAFKEEDSNLNDNDIAYLLNQNDGSSLSNERKAELDAKKSTLVPKVKKQFTQDILTNTIFSQSYTEAAEQGFQSWVETQLKMLADHTPTRFGIAKDTITKAIERKNKKGELEGVKQGTINDLIEHGFTLHASINDGFYFIDKKTREQYIIKDYQLITDNEDIIGLIDLFNQNKKHLGAVDIQDVYNNLKVIFTLLHGVYTSKAPGQSNTDSDPIARDLAAYAWSQE